SGGRATKVPRQVSAPSTQTICAAHPSSVAPHGAPSPAQASVVLVVDVVGAILVVESGERGARRGRRRGASRAEDVAVLLVGRGLRLVREVRLLGAAEARGAVRCEPRARLVVGLAARTLAALLVEGAIPQSGARRRHVAVRDAHDRPREVAGDGGLAPER